jgi:uncharacterized membrane protein
VTAAEHRLYLVLVAVHVLSAVVAFGPICAVPLVRRQLRDPRAAAAVELAVCRRLLTPAMTVLLASGLVQVAWGPRALGEPWVLTTLGILLVLFALTGAGLTRTARAVAEGGPGDDQGWFRLTVLWQLAAGLAVAALAFMVVKPGG